jgi:hypothetical protein
MHYLFFFYLQKAHKEALNEASHVNDIIVHNNLYQ